MRTRGAIGAATAQDKSQPFLRQRLARVGSIASGLIPSTSAQPVRLCVTPL